VVICLERGADLHTAQLMPLTVSCFSKIQIGFTFLVPAHLASPGQRAVKHVCVCVCGVKPQLIQSLCVYMQEYYIFRDGDILGKFMDTESAAQSAWMSN